MNFFVESAAVTEDSLAETATHVITPRDFGDVDAAVWAGSREKPFVEGT